MWTCLTFGMGICHKRNCNLTYEILLSPHLNNYTHSGDRAEHWRYICKILIQCKVCTLAVVNSRPYEIYITLSFTLLFRSTRWCSCLRRCTTSRMAAISIPVEVVPIFLSIFFTVQELRYRSKKPTTCTRVFCFRHTILKHIYTH